MKETNRIVQLDFIRSIAVVLVILFHYNVYASKIPFYNVFILNGGVIGVIAFFILSGYLMTTFYTQLIEGGLSAVKVGSFYSSRFFRIVPLFFITTLLFFLLREHIEVYRHNGQHLDGFDFLGGIFFLNNKLFAINPVIWTLKVEIIFYLVFPVIGSLLQKFYLSGNYVLLIVLPLLIISLSLFSQYSHWDNIFLDNLCGLAVGILIRVLVLICKRNNMEINIKSLYFIFMNVVIITLLCVFLVHNKEKDFYFKFFVSILMGAGVYAILHIDKGSFILKLLRFSGFYYIAIISYSLYLLHFNIYYNIVKPSLMELQLSNARVYGILCPLLSICLTVAVSVLTYHLIEKQSLKFKKIAWLNVSKK